jgi:Protein of unknown function (DUF2934)
MIHDPVDCQRIAELAFALWMKRGRPMGSPELDWERAQELLAHDSGIYPAMRKEHLAANDDKLDGNGFERDASVSDALNAAPTIFVS